MRSWIFGMVGFLAAPLGAQRPTCNFPDSVSDSVLAARVMAPYRDSTDILAIARVSAAARSTMPVSVLIIRGSIYDADYAALFANRCASRPVLRGTGWAAKIDSNAVPQWNQFIAGAYTGREPETVEMAKALGVLFLSFGTGHPLTLSDSAEFLSYRGPTREEMTPVEVRDVIASCAQKRCEVSGVWEPARGVSQRFRVVLKGRSVESALLISPGAP